MERAPHGFAVAVGGAHLARDGLVDQEPLLGQVHRHLVLGQDVLLDTHVYLGATFAGLGADLPDAQVGLVRDGDLEGSHAVLVGLDGLLEDLGALGVLEVHRGLHRDGLELRVEGDEPHVEGLARLVDGLVGLKEEERALLDPHARLVAEALAADLNLVVAVRQAWHLELDGALALELGALGQHLAAVLEQPDLGWTGGQLVAAEQRQGDGLALAGPQDAGHQGHVAVDGRLGVGAGASEAEQDDEGQQYGADGESGVSHGFPPNVLPFRRTEAGKSSLAAGRCHRMR